MKGLVLAAGFGVRLRPHSLHTPKSLFPVGGRSLLSRWIHRLADAGCEAVAVNAHHLPEAIAAAVAAETFPAPVVFRHEPERLGTGGAIRNLADFWDDRPFLVANADVWTDMDPAALYAFHRTHGAPATLALWDDPSINTVAVDGESRVIGFDPEIPGTKRLTFTGVQVLDPAVLDFIPDGAPADSIEAFRRMIRAGTPPRAWRPPGGFWRDIGTPERYRTTVLESMLEETFGSAGAGSSEPVSIVPIPGDASDRAWFRVRRGGRGAVLADHGIRRTADGQTEADAFVDIGRHLRARGAAVPRILAEERFAGLVLAEDLGSDHLRDRVRRAENRAEVEALYLRTLDAAIELWTRGREDFDPGWTWQTPRYDRSVIVEAEGDYFVDAFLRGVHGLDVGPGDFREEFEALADRIAETGIEGFLHRDMQSRNILIRPDGRPFFIDFQGGRIGPVQYDLAALLIDPYTDLAPDLRDRLRDEAARRAAPRLGATPETFLRGFGPCALARNLQMLGAFGYLSRVRGKIRFAAYIPSALATLGRTLASGTAGDYPRLRETVEALFREKASGSPETPASRGAD